VNLSSEGRELIKYFEGLRLEAYRDSVGVLTIGYGHTEGVFEGQTITESVADELFGADIRRFEIAVTKLIKLGLRQRQFDALVSFAFNLGENALRSSTLLKKLNAGAEADTEFLRWVHAGGKALPGLIIRRMAERLLFLNRDWRIVL
jgi:lysozyme